MKLRKRFSVFIFSVFFLFFSSPSISEINNHTIKFSFHPGIYAGLPMEFWIFVYSVHYQQLFYLSNSLLWVPVQTFDDMKPTVAVSAVEEYEDVKLNLPPELINDDAVFVFAGDTIVNGRPDYRILRGFEKEFVNEMGTSSISYLADSNEVEIGIDATGIEGEKIDLYLYVVSGEMSQPKYNYLNKALAWTETNLESDIEFALTINAITVAGVKVPLPFSKQQLDAFKQKLDESKQKLDINFGYRFHDGDGFNPYDRDAIRLARIPIKF